VGNDAYSIKPLQNAVNDVRLMNKALMTAGFRTIVRENANKAVMEQAAAEFLQAIGPGDTALFFYAGHAVQIENENVLIPVDFESSRTVIEARFRSFSLAMIFEYLKRSRAKNTIVIIDACRSNPVAEGHALQAGLAQPANAGKETYIAFSTSPNHVAADNPDGKNSWFTEALSDQITQEGLTLDEIFTRVRMQVEKATRGAQIPWSLTSLTTKFYFRAPKGALAQNDPSLADQWIEESRTREQFGDWEDALNLLERVLKQQPGGAAEETAKIRLPYVKARLEASTQFASGHFSEAAQKFEEALRLDPLAVDAAEGAFRSHLLREDLGKAVSALQLVRQRGASPVSNKADLALKELAAVSPEAAEELKRGKPEPPPVQDLFPHTRFGLPDWVALQRAIKQTRSADLGKWAKQLPEPPAPAAAPPEQVASAPSATPAPGAAPGAADEAISLANFHVEIRSLSATRDLIREEFGELRMKSALPNTTVLLDGRPITRQLPYTMKVPAGKYVIRTVDSGQTLGSQEIEVKAGVALELAFK
jgi:tetratricopeptide (TPR) repeat protein